MAERAKTSLFLAESGLESALLGPRASPFRVSSSRSSLRPLARPRFSDVSEKWGVSCCSVAPGWLREKRCRGPFRGLNCSGARRGPHPKVQPRGWPPILEHRQPDPSRGPKAPTPLQRSPHPSVQGPPSGPEHELTPQGSTRLFRPGFVDTLTTHRLRGRGTSRQPHSFTDHPTSASRRQHHVST